MLSCIRYLSPFAILLLAGCSSSPTPPDHLLQTHIDAHGTTQFQLNHFGKITEAEASKSHQSKPQRKGKGGGGGGGGGKPSRGGREQQGEASTKVAQQQPVPQHQGLEEHFLINLLDKELTQRQLCLNGYKITQQRPTTNGTVIFGECLPNSAQHQPVNEQSYGTKAT